MFRFLEDKSDDFHVAKKFLSLFDLNKLVDTIIKSDSENINLFRDTMAYAYRSGKINIYFEDDYESLEQFKEKLEAINVEQFDSIKQWNIKKIIEYVEIALKMKIKKDNE